MKRSTKRSTKRATTKKAGACCASCARGERCEGKPRRRYGKAAGAYVAEEVRDTARTGRSRKQAVAIGLSRARKAGVKVPAKPPHLNLVRVHLDARGVSAGGKRFKPGASVYHFDDEDKGRFHGYVYAKTRTEAARKVRRKIRQPRATFYRGM